MPAPFEDFVKIANFFYASVGIEAYESKIPVQSRIVSLKNFIFYFSVINLNSFALGECIFVFLAFYTGTNFVEATATASYIGYVMVSDCKMISVDTNKKVLTKLIRKLEEMYPNTKPLQESYHLRNYLKHVTTVMLMFSSLYMALIWTFNLFPIVQYLTYKYYFEVEIEQYLPYYIYTPWDWRNTGWYYYLNVMQIFAGWTSTAGIISSDLLLCAVATQVCMHYDYLAKNLVSYTPSGGQGDIKFLKEMVLYHREVLKCSEDINAAFGIPLLFNFAASTVIICFVGFQMTTGITTEKVLKSILFLSASLAQVFLISYYGQRISTSSQNIADALFNQIWYKQSNTSYKKCLMIMMHRAQKPARLKATVFMAISLATFTEIGQLSYKFFTLLRTMYVKK